MQLSKFRTSNPDWDLWGTARRNGYDVQMVWYACADCLASAFDLSNDEIRDLLDSSFGRHLVDDLSFMPDGPKTKILITHKLQARLGSPAWHGWFQEQ